MKNNKNLKINNLILKDPNSFEKYAFSVTIDLESGDNIEHFKNILYFVLRDSHIGKDNNILYSKLSLEDKED